MRSVATATPHDHVSQNAAPHAARDRILRAAFLLDLYPPRIRNFEILGAHDRIWVNASMGAKA